MTLAAHVQLLLLPNPRSRGGGGGGGREGILILSCNSCGVNGRDVLIRTSMKVVSYFDVAGGRVCVMVRQAHTQGLGGGSIVPPQL